MFGEHEDKVVDQLRRCMDAEEGSRGVLCGDAHFGYSQPVGGVVAYRDHISPAGVGYDIGCGNKAVATNVLVSDLGGDISSVMDEIERRISFGKGVPNSERVDHQVLERIAREAPMPGIRDLHGLAAKQLGTVGGGNHYVDLFRESGTDRLWVGVHFGSRGFGHRIASGFLSLAQGGSFTDRGKEGSMESPPALLHTGSPLGHLYIEAMDLAGDYAYAGRDVVVDKVLEIVGADIVREVHNHHNYAWNERHFGEDWWVIRKGCTPAFPGQQGFVGSTMTEPSVILEGVGSERSAESLYSTVHGAGRAMSRTQAAGKSRKRWSCTNRDCDWVQLPHTHKPDDGLCPRCGHNQLSKHWVREQEGAIDWSEVETELASRRIELRGANAEEAPLAYKRLGDVLRHHQGTIEVITTLLPIGVAMAPSGVPADD